MNKVKMNEVYSKNLIQNVADLANEIWHEHYGDLLPAGQIDYMVEKFQSEEAIGRQIIGGYKYFLAEVDGQYVGYIGIRPEIDQKKVFISKAYLLKEYRGRGIFRQMFEHVVMLAKNWGCTILWLTVNRGNEGSIAAYKHLGFEILREEDSPIGEGYVMNDYIMEYCIIFDKDIY